MFTIHFLEAMHATRGKDVGNDFKTIVSKDRINFKLTT